jgi:molybdopterin molybdotransferase
MMAPLIPVDEVIMRLIDAAVPTARTESVPVAQAFNRVAAVDVRSAVAVPPAANSAMDGYALRVADNLAVGGSYAVSARIPAGANPRALVPGTLARIFTGASIPPNADAVVIQEDTAHDGDRVRILEMPAVGENVRPRGQDIAAGDVIIREGDWLGPQHLGLAASVGLAELPTRAPLRVALLATGDELVDPPAVLAPGQIYNSGRQTLGGLLTQMGMQVVDGGIVPDTRGATTEALRFAAEGADCVISTGGVSVGEEDHVKASILELGELSLWRIAIKPGKPLAFGHVCGTPFFGLPGNPVSSFVTFQIIARPYLRALAGATAVQNQWLPVAVDFDFKAGDRREYLRVRTVGDGDGGMRLERFANQGSGVLSSVVWATGLAEIEVGQRVQSGDTVRYFPLG